MFKAKKMIFFLMMNELLVLSDLSGKKNRNLYEAIARDKEATRNQDAEFNDENYKFLYSLNKTSTEIINYRILEADKCGTDCDECFKNSESTCKNCEATFHLTSTKNNCEETYITCYDGFYFADTEKGCVNGISGNYRGSSSRKSLSGGAIAGVVIACVAVVAIVGFIFVFVVKAGVAAGSATSAVSTCSNIGVGVASNSNEPVGKF